MVTFFIFACLPSQDIYSFAVVLWCMLTGQEPWQGLGAVSIAVQVALRGLSLLSVPQALAEERCPPKLKRLLADCFEPDPRRRPAVSGAWMRMQWSCRE